MQIRREADVATVVLERGKVNAINAEVVGELRAAFEALERDADVRAVILTGSGKFFSFGFDIPELLPWPKEQFAEFLRAFTGFYTDLFRYPKPVVAAINGHAIAGGCMLALACDHRVMVRGSAKISLNEITFGSSVLAGSVEMLKFRAGGANATSVLYSGAMYLAEEAMAIGLIDESADDVLAAAKNTAAELGSKGPAFASMKFLLRRAVVDEMVKREDAWISEFVEIWYSEATRAHLRRIVIRS